MKTGKSITVVLTGLSLAFALSFGALAHSSFIWETDWRPFHVLPFTFTLSVAAEYAALTFIARVEQPWKTLAIVLIGNILAYGAACVYYFWSNDDEYPGFAWAAVHHRRGVLRCQLHVRGAHRVRDAQEGHEGGVYAAHLDAADNQHRDRRRQRPGRAANLRRALGSLNSGAQIEQSDPGFARVFFTPKCAANSCKMALGVI